jgi:hypothetical protein
VEHVEVTLEDIATANRLAGEVLGRSLDEMPPQTRRFLDLLHDLVTKQCQEQEIQPRHYRFTQRQARAFTGWTAFQVKKHLAKLVDLEYVLIHRGSRGQQFIYELVYNGEGRDGASFLRGLIDVASLRTATPQGRDGAPDPSTNYDANQEHLNRHREHDGSPSAAPVLQGGSTGQSATPPNSDAAQRHIAKKQPRKSRPGSASETQRS